MHIHKHLVTSAKGPPTNPVSHRLQLTYRMKGRIPMSGALFGLLVSDLVPKSTVVNRTQELTELRVLTQQQLAALVCAVRGHKYLIHLIELE